MSEELSWSKEDMVQVTLKEPDDFLKVRETLTRIGVASKKERKLFQSCHIPVSYTHLTLPTTPYV